MRIPRRSLLSVCLLCLAISKIVNAQTPATGNDGTPQYRNPNLAIEDRVADLISRMTLEEKVEQLVPARGDEVSVIDPTGTFTNDTARQTLARIGTRGELQNPIKALSGGNQQKVLFGRIIEQDARLILLDEPTKGVDIGAKSDIYDIIYELAEQGRCVVVVSSEEEELLEVADWIVVFRHGTCDGHSIPASQLTIADLRREAWTAAPHEGVR